ncbi:alanine racemase [Candidatus Uhrbacteria bacterium]|nr:alanine racemase [Candidatus Uhrbacteria bacterium]
MSDTSTWIELSRNALIHNLNILRSRTIGQRLVVPIKGNAYGHGMLEMASMLVDQGVDCLAVTTVDEACELRDNGIVVDIFMLSSALPSEYDLVVALGVTIVAHDLDLAHGVSDSAVRSGKTVDVHVEIDTGMGRQGHVKDSLGEFMRELDELPGIRVTGLMTHFATSDELDSDGRRYFSDQLGSFRKLAGELKTLYPSIVELHCGNSGAILSNDLADMTMARPGIAVYGLWPSESVARASELELMPVLSWKTRVVQVKDLEADSFISYGCTYRTTRNTKIAILPVGYYDGLFRSLSNAGRVLVNGTSVPILGRVCMNHTVVDVTDIDVKVGAEVVLIGVQGEERITAEDHARWEGTINYECVTKLARHIQRTVINR